MGSPDLPRRRMASDILKVDTSFAANFAPSSLTLHDLEAVRLILQGQSVVDWHKLNLSTVEEVDAHLRLQHLDPDDPADVERLRFLFNQAINYLEEHHDIRFPKELRDPKDVRDVFIAASTWTGRFRRTQSLACMLLKIMHTINHMDASDLKHRLAISEAELFDRAERVIIQYADRMRAEGFPLLAFYGSRKTRTSVISKLLTKRDTLAATIFDKLRFRVVVGQQDEVLPVLAHLTHTLFPFNYVIPEASHNNLLVMRRLIREDPHYARLAPKMQRLAARNPEPAGANPFSGQSYRMINFIVDFPVRVDDVVAKMSPETHLMLGSVVYVMVEFQVIDKATAEANEEGENAHHIYKNRQRRIVESRLLRGSTPTAGRQSKTS
ncbi:TIGR04552 family protein [Myxococcota bacterium]|nr:TIGR04552 family protein [Myxococcota bacterium]